MNKLEFSIKLYINILKTFCDTNTNTYSDFMKKKLGILKKNVFYSKYQTFLWVFELRMNVFAILLKILFEIPQSN